MEAVKPVVQGKKLDGDALLALLNNLGACDPARAWLGDPDGANESDEPLGAKRDPETAWTECERADWMLWAAARVGVDRKLVVLTACRLAREVLRHVTPGEDRPLRCIETTERWARGEPGVTLDDVRKARREAWAAAAAAAAATAAADADAAAAAAAADAAAAAAAAADAADAAATAADAAADAAATAAARAGRVYSDTWWRVHNEKKAEGLKRLAGIVRETLPWSVVEEAMLAKAQSEGIA